VEQSRFTKFLRGIAGAISVQFRGALKLTARGLFFILKLRVGSRGLVLPDHSPRKEEQRKARSAERRC
jgi:hypothetical protein